MGMAGKRHIVSIIAIAVSVALIVPCEGKYIRSYSEHHPRHRSNGYEYVYEHSEERDKEWESEEREMEMEREREWERQRERDWDYDRHSHRHWREEDDDEFDRHSHRHSHHSIPPPPHHHQRPLHRTHTIPSIPPLQDIDLLQQDEGKDLEQSNSPPHNLEDDPNGDDDDNAVNLNIAVSGANAAGIGDAPANRFPMPLVPGAYPLNGVMGAGVLQPGMLQPGMVQPGMLQPGMGMVQPGMIQNRPGNAPRRSGYYFGFGTHPPSRFGDNCTVSDIDVGCFTFTCIIPDFPFEEETYHGANSCRMLVKPLNRPPRTGSVSMDATRFKEFGPITPEGPYKPGDILSHRFEGLPSIGSSFGVGMVCENQFGVTKYVDRRTGQMFEVKLKSGLCPEAPEAPQALRDYSTPSTVFVEWRLSKDFHGSYENARCKVVMRREGKVVIPLQNNQRDILVTSGSDGKLQLTTFTDIDLRETSFQAMCSNAYCQSPNGTSSTPGWVASPRVLLKNQCPLRVDTAVDQQRSDQTAAVTFINKLNEPVTIYRVGANGAESELAVLEGGSQASQPTFISNIWRVRPKIGGRLLSQITVNTERTIISVEDCAELSSAGQKLKVTLDKENAENIQETRQYVADRTPRKFIMTPLEICTSPRNVEAEACCNIQPLLDEAESPKMLEQRCKQLKWTEARTETFPKPALSSDKFIGCSFDTSGKLSRDGLARCYYQPPSTTEGGEDDMNSDFDLERDIGGSAIVQQPTSLLDSLIDNEN